MTRPIRRCRLIRRLRCTCIPVARFRVCGISSISTTTSESRICFLRELSSQLMDGFVLIFHEQVWVSNSRRQMPNGSRPSNVYSRILKTKVWHQEEAEQDRSRSRRSHSDRDSERSHLRRGSLAVGFSPFGVSRIFRRRRCIESYQAQQFHGGSSKCVPST